MEWIHFSDFHHGGSRGPQKLALTSLLEAVEEVCDASTKIDAIFFTGDLAFSGQDIEYERFTEDFLLPLKKIKKLGNAKIFSVPGNHDVNCEISLPIDWNAIQERNQKVFFCEDACGINARKDRAQTFSAYMKFIRDNEIISTNPLTEVSLLYEDNSLPFDIIMTNTAFFSDYAKNSSTPTTPAPLASIRELLKGQNEKPFIILSHHPLTCLLPAHARQLQTLLQEKKAVLLHGHEHEPKVNFNADGTIRTLGFGASYTVSLEEQNPHPYLNSFTYCKLNNKLHISSFCWHPNPGKWLNTTAAKLSDCFITDKPGPIATTQFPKVSSTIKTSFTTTSPANISRMPPNPKQIIPIKQPKNEIWEKLISVSDNLYSIFQKNGIKVQTTQQPDGKVNVDLDHLDGKRDLLIFVTGINHVLSSKEIESINTTLDTEGYSSATLISFGKISDEAKEMYLRLKKRKSIEVFVNNDLTQKSNSLLSKEQMKVLSKLDAAKHSVCILIGEKDIFMLVVNETEINKSFFVVPSSGNQLNSTDQIIAELRKSTPEFANMEYAGENKFCSIKIKEEFSEKDYLSSCYAEYNVMKYAALANFGVRFSDLPLKDLYVSASACEIPEDSSRRSRQIINDHISGYPVSDELKADIEELLLSQTEHNDRQEISMAREFYQRYGAVLITGDPGSGKTCFVKNEILTYCNRATKQIPNEDQNNLDWYSSHIPIMIQLSKAVAEKDLESEGLFPIISRLLDRQGLFLTETQIMQCAQQGKLAFFFDGLDEVVSIEKRALIVKHINDIIDTYLPIGNRVIVTSRPAAVQVVNLLPSLHKLELQGLTEQEIQSLASRILELKLLETEEGVKVDIKAGKRSNSKLIHQLINDCEDNPGLSRLAQNPLLLTLLIMTYANSGALSAKKHLIYEEAIKTLASVRSRETGHHPISLQDLRERLGAIALSVYRNASGLLPSRAEVCKIIQGVMERQRGEKVNSNDADSFIQKVAEATGLIAIESRNNKETDSATVTFMHHSFLEYFAAVGLSREVDKIDISLLVNESRWLEILTLLSGIIGESEDIAPIISKFLKSENKLSKIDAKLLLFSIDCALECDIPSEATQRLLTSNIKECIINGPAKLDPWIRSELGTRLALLFGICGGIEFDKMLSSLTKEKDSKTVSATIDVIGHAFSKGYNSALILNDFEKMCSCTDYDILCAICNAISNSTSLRSEKSLNVISRCLQKSQKCKYAAFEALATIPGLASKHWADIINGIDDKNKKISRLSSIAAINAGLNVDLITLKSYKKSIVIRALDQMDKSGISREYHNTHIQKETIEKFIMEDNIQDKILAIRLLPFTGFDTQYTYDKLMEILTSNDSSREHIVSALSALKWSERVLTLITPKDLRIIIDLSKTGTSDIKIAALQLLGHFRENKNAIQALLKNNLSQLNILEYCTCINSLANARIEIDNVKAVLFSELEEYLNFKKKINSHNRKKIIALLNSTKRLNETAPQAVVNKVKSLITNYRVEEYIRRRAMLCYPAISLPSDTMIISIIDFFKKPPKNLDSSLIQVPSILAKKCRQNIDYVVACIKSMSQLREEILVYYWKIEKRPINDYTEYYISELRQGIKDITQIIVAFNDFIEKNNGRV